jgi:hypothetical protein
MQTGVTSSSIADKAQPRKSAGLFIGIGGAVLAAGALVYAFALRRPEVPAAPVASVATTPSATAPVAPVVTVVITAVPTATASVAQAPPADSSTAAKSANKPLGVVPPGGKHPTTTGSAHPNTWKPPNDGI